jgi:RimJ/RimL family protein N-acetyltransferase
MGVVGLASQGTHQDLRSKPMPIDLLLRDVIEDDLPFFFGQRLDPNANPMAAFTAQAPANREVYNGHWNTILADATTIIKTIVLDGQVVGSVLSYEECGKLEISYWIGEAYWGRGIATQALRAFLAEANRTRPMYARVAKDNTGSLRVLEKCGFTIAGHAQELADALDEDTEEWILELAGDARDGVY